MKEHDLKKIDTIVLQIGQLSQVYPKYLEDVYPIAVENTLLKDTKLEIEIAPGIGRCLSCNFVYQLVENHNCCPKCKSNTYEVISGTDFFIKQIYAY